MSLLVRRFLKYLSTALFLLCALVVLAQENEVWTCRESDYRSPNGGEVKWERTSVNASNILVTLEGSYSKFTQDGVETPLECNLRGGLWSCSNEFNVLLLNSETGRASLSYLLGTLNYRGSVETILYQCAKF